MTEDSSSGENGADAGAAERDGADAGAAERGSTAPHDHSSGPAVVGAWTGATDCAACGATVRRTWVEDGVRVCGDCRAW